MCFWYFSIPFFASLHFYFLLFIIISHSILVTSFLSLPPYSMIRIIMENVCYKCCYELGVVIT